MEIFSNLFRRKEESNTFVFANKILELQKRIEKLEAENVELTNSIYECENRMEAKIDKIQPVVYNLTTKEPIG
jgi:prefoldin subunit 5|tara:strand:+ start:782 stop:1000 length:219 start_codon:yes stop_codon:yes gene_type:complete